MVNTGLDSFLHSVFLIPYFFVPGLTENALRLYGPMLDRRVKAEKIRLTLSVLEQWKFFFGLPATLQSQFKKVGKSG